MKTSLFDYNLPLDLIAQEPIAKRDESRMLVYEHKKKCVEHRLFKNIIDYLNPGDVVVINDTRVIPASLKGNKQTGASIEVLLLKELEKGIWHCLVRPGGRLKIGTQIVFEKNICAKVIERNNDGSRIIEFLEKDIRDYLDDIGEMPLPPYIKRQKKNILDNKRYQTVFGKKYGAIAAPTAGLHFTDEIFKALKQKGVNIAPVTLHVGLGTFKPVSVENIKEHKMHEEYYEISELSANIINDARSKGGKIFAIGTTSARVLESAVNNQGKVVAKQDTTDLFVYPPYKFKVADSLLTNFHLPKSTLLMMVSALVGREKMFELYQIAIKEKYRFYSYGDCMLIC